MRANSDVQTHFGPTFPHYSMHLLLKIFGQANKVKMSLYSLHWLSAQCLLSRLAIATLRLDNGVQQLRKKIRAGGWVNNKDVRR